MGYRTDFVGCVKTNKPLTREQADFLRKFSETRRMKRDEEKASKMDDMARIAAGIMSVGVEGGYFTGGIGFAGQDRDESVMDLNKQPEGQPGLWCKWTVDESGEYIGWNGCEKFYDYVEWLRYLIEHFFTPWGVNLNGTIRYRGESSGDRGAIVVKDNVVAKKTGSRAKATHADKMPRDSCLSWGKPAKA